MKMNELIFGVLILTLFSCSNQNTKKEKDISVDSVENKHINQQIPRKDNTLDTIIHGKRVFIKDTTKYSLFFINQLESVYSEYDSLRIIDDSLFLYNGKLQNQDKVFLIKYKLPTELEENKEVEYSTKYNDKEYTLTLKRTNFTNLEYKLKEGNKIIKFGLASLQGVFFFDTETQPNEKNEIISMRQYLDNSLCRAVIAVQIENAERAIITCCLDMKKEEFIELPILLRK